MRFLAAVALSFCAATARAQYYGAVTGAGELTSLSVTGGSVLSTTTVLQTLYVGQGAAISTMTGAGIFVGTAVFSGPVTMTSGGGITGLAGSTFTFVNGSSVTFAGGINAMVEIGVQDYGSNCPNTVTWTLSNYLQSWETAASSITWRVKYDIGFSSTNWTPAMVFNNVNAAVYTVQGDIAYGNTGSVGYGYGTPADYLALADPSQPVSSGGIGSIGGSIDCQTIDGNSGVLRCAGQTGGYLQSTGPNYGSSYYYAVANPEAVPTSMTFSGSTVAPTSGASNTIVPMCGHFELWRGPQHK